MLGLFGVTGFVATHESSLDVLVGSKNAGDGDNLGLSSMEDHGRGRGGEMRGFPPFPLDARSFSSSSWELNSLDSGCIISASVCRWNGVF